MNVNRSTQNNWLSNTNHMTGKFFKKGGKIRLEILSLQSHTNLPAGVDVIQASQGVTFTTQSQLLPGFTDTRLDLLRSYGLSAAPVTHPGHFTRVWGGSVHADKRQIGVLEGLGLIARNPMGGGGRSPAYW